MRAARPDRRAPEVVGPDVSQRRGSRHVRVVDNRPTGNTHNTNHTLLYDVEVLCALSEGAELKNLIFTIHTPFQK